MVSTFHFLDTVYSGHKLYQRQEQGKLSFHRLLLTQYNINYAILLSEEILTGWYLSPCWRRLIRVVETNILRYVPPAALLQTVQYLFLSPKYGIFVSFSIILPIQDFALYEYLWKCLLQPQSIMTLIAGIPWWYISLEIAMALPLIPACCIDSSKIVHHHYPICFSIVI